MPAEQTKELCQLTRDKLSEVHGLVEHFLNHTDIRKLVEESPEGKDAEDYLKEFLSDLRYLLVSCELGYEKVSLVLRRATFSEDFAERVLNEVVHTCIHNFYYPRNEVYEEDSRYSYTNHDPIRFRRRPPESMKKVTFTLSKIFEILRDELDYYETDTMNRVQMKKQHLTF
ncbi:DUF3907 family protein [Paludifilum halophilum]|uniref:DUF3907 domain-containing protein n=1 Tax=Paludifilum halophilum TaxID=1642702 RepID=A0A235B9R0_9BACL|nr:DUF3907 family protein [Paludifilum halophilum]OYD09024.1 hypothetical protein CHM34_04420 [Paludifilum halophilum]